MSERSVPSTSGSEVVRTSSLALPWVGLLALCLLGVANAVVFPLATGYQNGGEPLAAATGSLPHLALGALNAAVLFAAVRALPEGRGVPAWLVMLLGAGVRLAYLVTRVGSGAGSGDSDIPIYFGYGREFAGGAYPTMEYPQGALLLYRAAYELAGGDEGRFTWVFPLLTLCCELLTLWCLVRLAQRFAKPRLGAALALFCAVSPFTLVLWYSKYDAVPAALLALGVYLFAANRLGLSGAALALGGLCKWFPALAVAAFTLYLLRAGRWRGAISHALAAAAVVALVVLPFWFWSPDKVLATYRFHAERPLMGESLPYLLVRLLAPAAGVKPGRAPWFNIENGPLGNDLATALQLGAVALALLALFLLRPRPERATAYASVAVALFIVANRVFSPQYVLVLAVAYAAGLLALPASRGLALAAAPLLVLLTLCNYLVWPLWVPFWHAASALFFGLNVLLVVLLATKS